MVMVMRDPGVAPDTYGLPEYRVTKIVKERVGDEIRLLCGAERFGQIQWSYICVVKASDLLLMARECERMALEASNEMALSGNEAGHC